ncbi:OsmC family protein [Antrihabitans sp. YC2-6]|uniref:OsmC family protein n=1 Tax=Antrihabitans sp. YC2-6 TaxID=2799498 RepID=UPI0018F60829|nr:OsmC family protein [Antrihabitans sp. YC2-6]MBJ8343683.1 OsmC family protein [Antrihabitans sp. YC2-6]
MTTASSTRLGAIIDATADAVAADVANAHVVFRAAGAAQGAVGSAIKLGTYTVNVDEPPTLGGEDTAPNPVEFYLASLISCQVVTYRFWADRLGIAVDDISATAEGDLDVRGFFGLDDDVRAGFGEVRVQIQVTGPESADRYAELGRVVDAHCPVLDLTKNVTPVRTTLVVG